ncbi:DUF2474 family protein [Sphingomonas sp.]|jgi:hypothetical protein|nr:DUF2474 family protein [Sphingomonas sp.]MDF2493821.1 hypothetical protein [Sphingomonas sp.]
MDMDAPLWQRVGWMAFIWALSVSAIGILATLIRFWLKT